MINNNQLIEQVLHLHISCMGCPTVEWEMPGGMRR